MHWSNGCSRSAGAASSKRNGTARGVLPSGATPPACAAMA
jgi:hypothetical protein